MMLQLREQGPPFENLCSRGDLGLILGWTVKSPAELPKKHLRDTELNGNDKS